MNITEHLSILVIVCVTISCSLNLIVLSSVISISRYINKWKKSLPYNHKIYPHVTVLAPLRGKFNPVHVTSLLNQNYSGVWDVIFLTTDVDKAHQQIKPFLTKYPNTSLVCTTDVVTLSQKENLHRGQKCQNIIEGIESLPEETEYLAFIDADVNPPANWLETLIAPIAAKPDELKITTLLRFSDAHGNFVSKMQSAWFLGAISLMVGPWNYVWGGSYALSKKTLNSLGGVSIWNGKSHWFVCEDLTLTRKLKQKKGKVIYIPHLPIIYESEKEALSLPKVITFANRQMLHLLWGKLDLWYLIFFTHVVKTLAALCALLLVWIEPVALLALFSFVTDIILLKIIVLLLANATPKSLDVDNAFRTAPFYAASAVFLVIFNAFHSIFQRKIEWGGIVYSRTRVLGYSNDVSWRDQHKF